MKRILSSLLLGIVVPALAAAAPVRVATLLPYVADAITQAGGDAVVVATVRRQLSTAPAAPMVDLGNPHAPSLERIAEATPDVIVADQDLHGMLGDKLKALAKDVVLVRSGSVDETLAGLLEVGKRAGIAKRMETLVDATRAKLTSLAAGPKVPVLVLFGVPGSFMVVTPRTWIGDLVQRVGLENVAAHVSGDERHPGLVQLDDEALSQLKPQRLLLVAHGDPTAVKSALEQRLAAGGSLAALGMAVHGAVQVLPIESFSSNPGLGLSDAAARLRDASSERVGSRE